MATLIPPELFGEFTSAVLAACPPERWAGSGALCALLEQGDTPLPQDAAAVEAKLCTRLEQHPDDLEALCALDRLHKGPNYLIEVLRRRYDLAVDHDERWRLLVRLGLLHIAAGSVDGVRSVITTLAPLRVRVGAS